MDENRLKEIEKRAAKASKGPWAAVGVDRRPYISHTWRVQDPSFMNLANFIDAEDAAFIAASRQDIPDLLVEVKRLRELLEEVQPFMRHDDNCEMITQENHCSCGLGYLVYEINKEKQKED